MDRARHADLGAVSAAFVLIGGPISFLVLRFLLGAAEAGFFPGVILYLTYWYPAALFTVRVPNPAPILLPIPVKLTCCLTQAQP